MSEESTSEDSLSAIIVSTCGTGFVAPPNIEDDDVTEGDV